MIKYPNQLRIKLFADGADLPGMLEMYANPLVKGFTTNPSLMRRAGVTDYLTFARTVLDKIPDRPVSFEVFADDLPEMERQARQIASWGGMVNVKIPITNSKGESTAPLIAHLSADGIVLNITALFTLQQVRIVAESLAPDVAAIVSVFAGRVADSGLDPVPHMSQCLTLLQDRPRAELLWASPREVWNVFQADEIGCHIITATNDILQKLSLVGRDLTEYSLETISIFYQDALASGYAIG